MTPVFVDTGAWIALAVRRDRVHGAAAAYARRLTETNTPLLTTNYVLLETYTRIRYDDGHDKALAFDAIIQDLLNRRRLILAWVTVPIHTQALEIFRTYVDQTFSLVDCASFFVARDRKIQEVFGFDKNFLTMGFILKPGPTN